MYLSKLSFVEELLLFKSTRPKYFSRVLVNFRIMHLRKWRSFLTLIKRKEVNPVIKKRSYFNLLNFFTDWKNSKQ